MPTNKSNMKNGFKPGTIVTWDSQGGSHEKTKVGEVIANIPAGEKMYALLPEKTPSSRIMAQNISQIDRVLVAVERGQDYDWYAPRPSQLIVRKAAG